MNFSTSLLREKFIIRPVKATDLPPVIALSNRIALNLPDMTGRAIERFIVRSQSMYGCVRMASSIVQTFFRQGPLLPREEKFDFTQAWNDIVYDAEGAFGEKNWASVYNKGKLIFRSGDPHGFLDVIENCDYRNDTGNYERSVFLAEEIFAEKGTSVSIEHQADTGVVLDINKNRARCAMILRSPIRRTNFNYVAEEKNMDRRLSAAQCLTVSAAFLEGIHHAYLIGRVNEGLRLGSIIRYSEEYKAADAARRRLPRLNAEIKNFENFFKVTYRPEKPEFPQLIVDAERYAHDEAMRKKAEKENQID